MREIRFRGSFHKSSKLMEKRGKDLAKLDYVMNTLSQHGTLPPKHRIHKLVGNHAGRWECHIEPNWLLIYTLDETTLTLLDTGTHSDLF